MLSFEGAEKRVSISAACIVSLGSSVDRGALSDQKNNAEFNGTLRSMDG